MKRVNQILSYVPLKFVGKVIRMHQRSLYIGALVVAFLATAFDIEAIVKGEFVLYLWALVMIAGVLAPTNPIGKFLRGIRKEVANLGFILLLPHAITFLVVGQWEWFGIAAFVIMIPLTITSFTWIRRKMRPAHRNQLHKLAYVSYVSIVIHLIAVGRTELIGILFVYGVLKIHYELAKRRTVHALQPS